MFKNSTIQQNRVYAPMIIGIVLFLITFVVYPLYTRYVDTDIIINSLEKTKQEKELKTDEIKKMQALFAGSGSSDLKAKVTKYSHAFNTSDIMETVMINKFTKISELTPPSISIGSISIHTGKKLPNGLSLATVSLALVGDTPDQIIDYLTYLTTESPLAFTIDSIALPLDTGSSPQDATKISLTISLGVYYYE